jgi:hypothetical protein
MEALGYKLELRKGDAGGLRLVEQPAHEKPNEYHNPAFDPTTNDEAKRSIGNTMAGLLHKIDEMHTFLGSGTTCYHVGLAMERLVQETGQPYRQIVWTVNIALAARWCNRSEHWPVRRVHVPEGVLDPMTYRYSQIARKPDWFAGFVVFSADGAFLNKETGKMDFYANSEEVKQATSFFISKATNAVFCCLTGDKLVAADRYKSGPTILLPENPDAPRRCLVTHGTLKPEVEAALKHDKWEIVRSVDEWDITGLTASLALKEDKDADLDALSHQAPGDESVEPR